MISIIILVVLGCLYFFIRRQYLYWDDSGIAHTKATFPFGNLKPVVKRERSFGLAIFDLYNSSKAQFLGIYLFFRPAILVRDAALVKTMLTTDFSHFHDRGVYHNPKHDPMSGNLFSLEGEEWKSLRSKLTPAFTSGKLKGMLDHVTSVSNNLVRFLQPYSEREETIDIRDMATRYVADCLASIAFGQDGISSIDNPNHEFRMNARRLNEASGMVEIIRRAAIFVCPSILKFLRVKGLPKFMREFCIGLVTKTIEHREQNNEVRKDLMQYLIQLRNNSANSDEWKINTINAGEFLI
jgi:cytochrome P450 family 6